MQIQGKTKFALSYTKETSTETARKDKQKKETNQGSFYAGNVFANDSELNLAQKKAKAQKSALKVLLDQHRKELKMDDKESGIADHQKEMIKTANEASKMLDSFEQQRDTLKEKYNIQTDNKSDLDLLDKQQRILDGSKETLTGSESARMNELTDYANENRKLDLATRDYEMVKQKALNKVVSDNMSLLSMKTERNKDQGMTDAQKNASDILKKASQETINYLYAQLKDNVDKKKDDADKQEEKQDAKDQKEQKKVDAANMTNTNSTSNATSTENNSSKAAAQSTMDTDLGKTQIKSMIKQDVKSDNFKAEVKVYIKKEKIIEDDTKGIEVDQRT